MRDDEFVSYLKDVHSGVQSCVSGAVLAKTFRVSENELRRRVNRLRRKGNRHHPQQVRRAGRKAPHPRRVKP